MNDREQNLEQELRAVARAKQGSYEWRTEHRDAEGEPRFINRLVHEDSPYLLQHAHNPVDWYPWGEEAFARATEENRPVFLSIGYSTCHWCHVMEVESFDNVEIARLLNQYFVSIKLDREQFPDIDEYYMTGVQIITGQGGWPMSNFLLPDGRPFYSATYFPPAQFSQLLERIASIWSSQRNELEGSAANVADRIQQLLQGRQGTRDLDLQRIGRDADRLLEREDASRGGLAGAPKFPQEPLLLYFLDGVCRDRDLRKAAFLQRALDAMGCGGIYDQAGGGFHRYSTDASWLVPHFEKMLYNQSQLSRVYLRAWQLTGRRFFKRIVTQTLDYVLREMMRPQGGFYSATDADSEDVEGLYFIWSLEELQTLLSDAEFDLLNKVYPLDAAGNFEGANILAMRKPIEALADELNLPDIESRLDPMLVKLHAARQQRSAPLRDDKLIVAWTAEMATALTLAGRELSRPDYLEAAVAALDAVWAECYEGSSSLRRISLHGTASIPAQLEDYVSLCEAFIVQFDTTGNSKHLLRAASLFEQALALFWNKQSGGFFLSQQQAAGPRLSRSSSAADGAIRSAYGIAVKCLALLAERRMLLKHFGCPSDTDYAALFHEATARVSAELDEYPPAHVTLIGAIRHHESGSMDTVRYGAEGWLRIAVRRETAVTSTPHADQVAVSIDLIASGGYHVTDDDDAGAGRKPVRISLVADEQHWQIEKVSKLSAEVTDFYAGTDHNSSRVVFDLRLRRTAVDDDLLSYSVGLELGVQLCDDTTCLLPEVFTFRI